MEPITWIGKDIHSIQMMATTFHQTLIPPARAQYFDTLLLVIIFSTSIYKASSVAIRYRRLYKTATNQQVYTSLGSTSIYQTPTKHSAFVVGLLKPVIVLPCYTSALSADEQGLIVQHELTHIKHKDHISLYLWQLLSELCWFNPFIKYLGNNLLQALEQRCDKETIKRTHCAPYFYAKTLLNCLKNDNSKQSTLVTADFNSIKASAEIYKTRINHIMQNQVTSLPSVIICIAIFISLFVMLFATHLVAATNTSSPNWRQPVDVVNISSAFGHIAKIRNHRPHRGIDYTGRVGTPIYAAADGIVAIADNTSLSASYGYTIVIKHSGKWQSLYAHIEQLHVKANQYVKQGEIIASMGNTGKSTGPHLHFEISRDGEVVNPEIYLK